MTSEVEISRITIPIPIKALKRINSYLISTGEKFVIIDTGTPTREAVATLIDGIENAGYQLKDIAGIIITHMHIDHIGNAGLLQEKSGAKVYMHGEEYEFVKYFIMNTKESFEDTGRILLKNGAPIELLENIAVTHPGLSARDYYKTIKEIEKVKDGEILKFGELKLRAIETPGHSPHHICLYLEDEKILFTGDHILSDITPNIRMPMDNENPLDEYINSLNKVEKLDVKKYYPGHREPSKPFYKRIEELKVHHFQRLMETVEILNEKPQNAYQIASKLTWDLKLPWEEFPVVQKFFAMSEALAHIRYLEEIGSIERKEENGTYTYRLNGETETIEETLKNKIL